jgi:nucleotide-binding universal stress UspA family protein
MYQHILLPIDLNAESSWVKALPTSVELCRTFGATLHLMTVVPDFGMSLVSQYFPAGTEERMRTDAAGRLREFAQERVPTDVEVQDVVAQGSTYREILDAAAAVAADLIVMGSHRPEASDYLLGANASRVVRHAKCSVMVIRT